MENTTTMPDKVMLAFLEDYDDSLFVDRVITQSSKKEKN